MIVNVTEQEIKRGRPSSPGFCPIALALRTQNILPACLVHPPFVYDWHVPTDTHTLIGYLGPKAHQWTQDFDNRKEVEPIRLIPQWTDGVWERVIEAKPTEERYLPTYHKITKWRWYWEVLDAN